MRTGVCVCVCVFFLSSPFFFNVLDFPAAEKVSCLLRCTTTEFFLIICLSVKKKKTREKFVRLNPNSMRWFHLDWSVRVIEVAAKCLFEFMFD